MSGEADDVFTVAGEFVLGGLDHGAQLEGEARRATDPAFAAAVMFWEDRLAPLYTLVAPVAPSPVLWSRLALATGVRAAVDPVSPARTWFWQSTTAAAALVAAGLAAFAFLPVLQAPAVRDQHFAAALAPLGAAVPFLAEARPDGQIVVTRTGGAAAAPGRAFQLWEVQSGSPKPVSLGVLPPGRSLVINQPAHGAWEQTQLLVSDEPAGGSPTGLPTGSVLFGGKFTPVQTPGR